MITVTDAICIRCGAPKRDPAHACGRCSLDPTSDPESLVRSVYLSIRRFDDPRQQAAYRPRLLQLAQFLEARIPVILDEGELQRLRERGRPAVAGAPGRLVGPLVD